MTTSDAPEDDYDEIRADLVRGSAALIRKREALIRDEDEIKRLIVRALKAGHASQRTGFRSDVQKIAPFSVPTVRALADEAGIPPDERYVKAAKVRRSREVADAAAPVRKPELASESLVRSRKPKLSPRVERLDPTRAARVAALAESHADGGWAARVIAEYPGIGANWHPYVVVEAGLHRGFIEDTDLSD